MSDRDKFLKHDKSDIIIFCKSKSINTGHCFAKIDFVNTILEKGFKYSDFNKKSNSINKRNSKNVGFKSNTVSLKSAVSPIPRAKLKKTATRFCVDADIDNDGELDIAEFILAAKYLGTDVDNDQLMETYMEHMEQIESDDTQANPKQVIKDLMVKVEDKYGTYVTSPDIEQTDADVYDVYAPEMAGNGIDDFLYTQQKEQQIEIARNLMQISTLTRQEIATMTGVDPNDLKQYESDSYDTESESDYETESDEEDTDKAHTKEKSVIVFDGIKIVNGKKKEILIPKSECNELKQIVSDGIDGIKAKPEECIKLLQILSDAIGLAPGAMRRAKTMARLNFNASDDQKEQEKLTFPAQFRVVITPGALIKSHQDRTDPASTIVARLPTGREVTIEEIVGKRCRISAPNEGWCSMKHSKDGRVIFERIDNSKKQSKQMIAAVKKEKMRKTQIEIVKNVTTLPEMTVVRLLEKSNWNTRVALDSFFIAKFKTQKYELMSEQKKEAKSAKKEQKSEEKSENNLPKKRSIKTSDMFKDIDEESNKNKKKKGWFKSWKAFANEK